MTAEFWLELAQALAQRIKLQLAIIGRVCKFKYLTLGKEMLLYGNPASFLEGHQTQKREFNSGMVESEQVDGCLILGGQLALLAQLESQRLLESLIVSWNQDLS